MLEILLIVGASAVGGVMMRGPQRVRRWWRASKQLELPEAVPGTAEGTRVRVTGAVVALEPELVAPLSGRMCVMYCATVHPRAKNGVPQRALGTSRFALDLGAAGQRDHRGHRHAARVAIHAASSVHG